MNDYSHKNVDGLHHAKLKQHVEQLPVQLNVEENYGLQFFPINPLQQEQRNLVWEQVKEQ